MMTTHTYSIMENVMRSHKEKTASEGWLNRLGLPSMITLNVDGYNTEYFMLRSLGVSS